MEVEEATFARCSPDSINEAAMDCHSSSESPRSSAAADDLTSACFDCNICLSFAADPVVTLCGHLYCWPCIHRWLRLDSAAADGRSHCPVCRSLFAESSLIPLYGSGINAKSDGIPDRPKDHRKLVSFGDHRRPGRFMYRSAEMMAGRSRGRRRRRSWQELRAESFLHQLWVFLFCCSVLCFVFF